MKRRRTHPQSRSSRPRQMQYTICNVPRQVEAALRSRARNENKNLNQFLLDQFAESAGIGEAEPRMHHDLDFMIGTWIEDPECESILEEQRTVDPDIWR